LVSKAYIEDLRQKKTMILKHKSNPSDVLETSFEFLTHARNPEDPPTKRFGTKENKTLATRATTKEGVHKAFHTVQWCWKETIQECVKVIVIALQRTATGKEGQTTM